MSRYTGRQLTKDSRHKKLGGVCAGLAEYLDISRFCVRIAAVISFLIAPHIVLMAYIAAYFILDDDLAYKHESYHDEACGRRYYD